MTGEDALLFSVVMATYGRGRHILPSVRSVLAQTGVAFELLVVGDACADETEAVVTGLGDPRLRWMNLEARVGSQSGPNNAGIAAARAGLIAYIGHDDLWEPDHLARLAEIYARGGADFVMSGVLLHPPPCMSGVEVMGLFPDGTDIRQHFFPPSAFSHRREAVERIGGWRLPVEIRPPPDDDLLARAAEAGLQFRSTGIVTVHKFSAAQRYLSYVLVASDEQEELLAAMGQEGHAARLAAWVDEARAGGRFMVRARKDYSGIAPGDLAGKAAARRGLRAVPLRVLDGPFTVRHPKEPAAHDWRSRPVLGFRLTKANPRPRLLLPVTGGRARLAFVAASRDRGALTQMTVECNGERLKAKVVHRWFGLIAWFARLEVEISLRPDAPTVLELHLNEVQRPDRCRLGIGPLHLAPA